MGDEVNIKEPSSQFFEEGMGIVICVVFCSLPHHQINDHCSLLCHLIVNGKVLSAKPSIGITVGLSDHSWLLYLHPQYYEEDIKLLKECEGNEFTQIGIKIEIQGSNIEVKKCGLHMIYKKNIKVLNHTMAQSSNTNIIPYEDLGVHNHNFDNSALVAEGNKAKRTHYNYDGVEPSGEGSSNNVPHPKRIERPAKFMVHGDSDCEEFFECGEEHND